MANNWNTKQRIGMAMMIVSLPLFLIAILNIVMRPSTFAIGAVIASWVILFIGKTLMKIGSHQAQDIKESQEELNNHS